MFDNFVFVRTQSAIFRLWPRHYLVPGRIICCPPLFIHFNIDLLVLSHFLRNLTVTSFHWKVIRTDVDRNCDEQILQMGNHPSPFACDRKIILFAQQKSIFCANFGSSSPTSDMTLLSVQKYILRLRNMGKCSIGQCPTH